MKFQEYTCSRFYSDWRASQFKYLAPQSVYLGRGKHSLQSAGTVAPPMGYWGIFGESASGRQKKRRVLGHERGDPAARLIISFAMLRTVSSNDLFPATCSSSRKSAIAFSRDDTCRRMTQILPIPNRPGGVAPRVRTQGGLGGRRFHRLAVDHAGGLAAPARPARGRSSAPRRGSSRTGNGA